MKTSGDSPVFPHGSYPYSMLTKRELFAAMAMQGLCANTISTTIANPEWVAMRSVGQADALIDALNAGRMES